MSLKNAQNLRKKFFHSESKSASHLKIIKSILRDYFYNDFCGKGTLPKSLLSSKCITRKIQRTLKKNKHKRPKLRKINYTFLH